MTKQINIAVYASDDLTKNKERINKHSANTVLEAAYQDPNINIYLFQDKDVKYTPQTGEPNIQLYEYDPTKILSGNPTENKFKPANIGLENIDKLVCKKDYPKEKLIFYLGEQFKEKIMINSANMFETATKEYVSQFSKFTPFTKITSNLESIIDQIKKMGPSIIKPNNADCGRGIIKVDYNKKNGKIICNNNETTKTYNEETFMNYLQNMQKTFGDEKIILQEFINKVYEGDKRILAMISKNEIDMEAISRRIPPSKNDKFIANLAQGGTRVGLPKITSHEKKIIESIAPTLYKDGVYMVGLDFIGDKLSELNPVNPGFKLTPKEINKINLYQRIANFLREA